MCVAYKNLTVEEYRQNINGKKVIFVDRSSTGPNGEIVVTELSLQLQKNTSILNTFLKLVLFVLLCTYAIYVNQNLLLISISVVVILVICFIYLHYYCIREETLTVVRSTGIQLSTIYATGRRKTSLVDLQHIDDIVINEAVTMHKIVYYLAILLNDHQKSRQPTRVLPVFLHSMPRLDTLTEIYQIVHDVLWDETAHRGIKDSS